MKLGCIAVVPAIGGGFVGIECAKGRGLILPGGKVETTDPSWNHTASRELVEETGLKIPHWDFKYLWQGPDGQNHIVMAYLASGRYKCPTKATAEGKPQVVWPCDLYKSTFAAYYRAMFEATIWTLTDCDCDDRWRWPGEQA
mgnify:CR=1 FL=1